MEKNQSFASYIQDGALICAFMILLPYAVGQISSIVAPEPVTSAFITVQEQDNPELYAEQNKILSAEKNKIQKMWSLLYLVLGTLLLTVGFFISTTALSVGVITGGIICVLLSCTFFWWQGEKPLRLLLLAIILAIFTLLTQKLTKKNR